MVRITAAWPITLTSRETHDYNAPLPRANYAFAVLGALRGSRREPSACSGGSRLDDL